MNKKNQEKVSPIIMMAPIAIVLLGYHYLFHAGLNSEIVSRQRQENALQRRATTVQQQQASVLGQFRVAQKELADAKSQTKVAEAELANANAEKAKLRSYIFGKSAAVDRLTASRFASHQRPNGSVVASTLTELEGMLVSTGAKRANQDHATASDDVGLSGRMNTLCSILDKHGLQRLRTSSAKSRTKSGVVESERFQLGELLGAKLPPVSRYEIQLLGNFSNLIAALHQLNDGLPSASILSISLEPVDIRTRQYVWRLQIGIRG